MFDMLKTRRSWELVLIDFPWIVYNPPVPWIGYDSPFPGVRLQSLMPGRAFMYNVPFEQHFGRGLCENFPDISRRSVACVCQSFACRSHREDVSEVRRSFQRRNWRHVRYIGSRSKILVSMIPTWRTSRNRQQLVILFGR